MYVVYIEQKNWNNKKIGPQHYIVFLNHKDITISSDVVIEMILLKTASYFLYLEGAHLPHSQVLVLETETKFLVAFIITVDFSFL